MLLLLLLLGGCRSADPPEETTAKKEIAPRLAAPLPPQNARPNSLQPAAAFEKPHPPYPPAPDETSLPPVAGEDRLAFLEKKRPRIAIIIDDMGNYRQLGRQLLQLDLNLTFAFLPNAPYTKEQAHIAFRAGRDILVHLPMEPKDAKWNLGADALKVQDPPQAIRAKMARMLGAVPHAMGANNHMGSRFTEDGPLMQVVIETLKDRSYFFIDSYTTPASQGWATARQQGLATARRHIFLDNVQDPQEIRRQFALLIAGAKKRGWAIGVGHPNQAMLIALSQGQCELFAEVEIVGVHRLVQ